MNVSIEGQIIDVASDASCAEALKKALSGKKFKSVLACRMNDTLVDLTTPIAEGTTVLEPVYVDSPEGLDMIRHSTAHIMASAVKRLFPAAKVTIGPSIENGFYYDFDVETPFTPEDFETIEAEMQRIVAEAIPFERMEMPRDEAIKLFEEMGENYKAEIISDLPNDVVSLYRCGDFLDLCRGPHMAHTGFARAFKLMSVAGAYWRGDEKNRMLSRIYGTAFADAKALKEHLHRLEEAKRRDHRKIGTQLDLFSFHEDVAPGMVFWHPKGMLVRTILEDFLRKEHLKRQYDIVQGPQLLRRELWEKSGHYDNYRENMYFTEIDENAYGVKPMNCLSHMIIYRSQLRSYRDLPKRFFELGVVHRHEKSGVLHGLLRVRQFTQDDAHIICRPDQLEDEIISVIALVRDLMALFGFDYKVAVSTRPEKSIGSDDAWELATNALIKAVEKAGIPYTINEGDGAFYGPKIDVRLMDCIGREWQCSTIQCDFTLPERFDLVYIGQDGERHRPVMVHRAILGSLERFVGILIEQYAGAFPAWLAPVQARLLTVTEAHNDFAEEARVALAKAGIRVEADIRNEKLGYKVREAQLEKIPYILVIGEKEVEAKGVNVRLRTGENLGLKSLDEVVSLLAADCQEPFNRGGMSYSFS